MKTKIFVCSNSAIDYVAHDPNISAIPVNLVLSEEEQYEDFIDVSTEAFYNRIRMDKNAHVKFSFQNYSKISQNIALAKSEGYEQVLFIIPPKEFANLYISISIAISENKDIPCYVYNADTILYPLAYMAIEANNMLSNSANIEEVITRLDYINKNHFICFFKHHNDEAKPDFRKKYQNGRIVLLEDGKLIEIKKEKNKTPYSQFIDLFDKDFKNKEIIPFILYTSKSSRYLDLIEDSLLNLNPCYKRIKYYPIAPAVGYQLGPDSIGVGYIIK